MLNTAEVDFWWVTQNQSFEEEVRGGYMWAPKLQKDGKSLTAYTNVSLVKPGDIIFSFVNTRIVAVGTALSGGYTAMKPHTGAAGELWANEGWRVDVDYSLVPNEYKPRDHLDVIGPLLPAKYSPLNAKTGHGAQGMYLSLLSDKLGEYLLSQIGVKPEALYFVEPDPFEKALVEDEQEIWENPELSKTEKQRLVLSRVGQGIFRKRVKLFESTCRVTGVGDDNYLIASHIKPWSVAGSDERLDGNNGLLLSPHIDRLFDRGYMTFAQNGDVFLSKELNKDVVLRWSLQGIENVGEFSAAQEHFLEHHRDLVFKQ